MNASAQQCKITAVLDVMGAGGLMSKRLPNYEARPQQVKVAELVQQGIQERRHVIVELGTGGGKSFAGLMPAVLSGERVLYSTAVKSLQEQIEEKDAPFVASLLEEALGRPIRVAVIKGRGNYVCLRNVEELEQGEGFRSPEAAAAFGKLLDWIGEQRAANDVADVEKFGGDLPTDLKLDVVTSTDECTGQKCRYYKECFAERAKARAAAANIVVANHKLTCIDAMIREVTEGQASAIPDYSVLIADECQDWEDVIRDTAGFEVTPGRVTRLGRLLQKLTIDHERAEQERAQRWADRQEIILHQIDGFLRQLKARLEKDEDAREIRLGDERDTLVGGTEQGKLMLAEDVVSGAMTPFQPKTIMQVVTDLSLFAQAMQGGTPSWLEDEERDQWMKLSEQTEKLARELATILSPDEDASWVRRASLDGENGKTRVVLDAKPVDVSGIAREWFFGSVKKQRVPRKRKDADGHEEPIEAQKPLVVVSMSATIATNGSMRMYRDRLGVGQNAIEHVAGSTFNYRENALLYLPGSPEDLTPVQRRDPKYPAYMNALCAEMKGLTLDAKGGAFLLFTSRSAMNDVHQMIADDLRAAGLLVMKQGDASRNQLISDFKENGNAVLFGLKTFGVGIDVQGSALRLVAIDKVPFNPPTDVIWYALCQDVKRRGGNDFRDLALPHAIITLKQFAGRLIRTHRDRGVMALLDGRVRTARYGSEIIKNLPDATITSDPDMVKAMYAKMGEERDLPYLPPVASVSVELEVTAVTAGKPLPPVGLVRRFGKLGDEARIERRFGRIERRPLVRR